MPLIAGYKDYKIPGELPEEEPAEGDDGHGVGPLDEDTGFLEEIDEPEPEESEDIQGELDEVNEEFKRVFREIGDGVQYQNLYYMVPLKTRLAPEVEAAIRLRSYQCRAGRWQWDTQLGLSESVHWGPQGEVVVPDQSTELSPGPTRRVRDKSTLMAMSPLTVLEQEIEELATQYDVDERYDEDAVLEIFELLERTRLKESKSAIRKSQS
ncbi:GIP, partial [Symbiodinium necroappetens]